MRFRLRTPLIVLAVGPVVLAGAWFAVSAMSPDAANYLWAIRWRAILGAAYFSACVAVVTYWRWAHSLS